MSDALNIIVKLITSLASPKACFKYVLICITILFSWKYLYSSPVIFDVSEDHRKIIILLFSVAVGSLTVELFATLYGKIQRNMQEKQQKIDKLTKQKNEQDFFKATFKETYNHLNDEQIVVLEKLLVSNETISLNSESDKILLENQYVIFLQKVSSSEVVVALNPLIKDIVQEKKDQMTKWLVEDFLTNKEEAVYILHLMENPPKEPKGKIKHEYLDEISKNPICIESEYSRNEDGYHLWFVRDRYKKYFELTNGKKYNNEAFIAINRIK